MLTNLTVAPNAFTHRMVFEGSCATCVEYEQDGTTTVAHIRSATPGRPRGDVLLSAGYVGSPHLVMLFGLGLRAGLAAHGIKVVVDARKSAPNVTTTLMVGIAWEEQEPLAPTPSNTAR